LLACWVIHSSNDFAFQKKMVSLSWVTCPVWRKLVYFQWRPTRTLILVYFHRWPAHTYSLWSVFRDDLPTHTHTGLFLGVTYPHILTPTHTSLFLGAIYPHILTLVYFHGRPAHTYSLWSIFRGDLPTHTHTGIFSWATCPFDWVNLRSHLAISFNQNQNRCVVWSTWNLIWRSPLIKKINTLKVERVQNTFENLNSSVMMLKMLKLMQIYQNAFFWGFHFFFTIFGFLWKFIKNMGQKLGINNLIKSKPK
jgi:hypothetical protein